MAKQLQSKPRRLPRRYVGRLPVAIEPLTRDLGYPVAQHIAQLGTVGLALLVQFLESFGVGRQFFHYRDVGCGTGRPLWPIGPAAGSQHGNQQGWSDLPHGVSSSG